LSISTQIKGLALGNGANWKQPSRNHLPANYTPGGIATELVIVLTASIYSLEYLKRTLLRQQPVYEPETALLGIPRQSGFPQLFMESHSLMASANALLFLRRGHGTLQEKSLSGGTLADSRIIASSSKVTPGHDRLSPFDSSMQNETSTHPTQPAISPQLTSPFNDSRIPVISLSSHSPSTPVPLPKFKKLHSERQSQDTTQTHSSSSQSPDPDSPCILPQSKKRWEEKRRTELSFWEHHYNQLTSLVTPFHEYHRNDPTHRTIWLNQYARNQKYQFKSNPRRRRLQNLRWAFIFAQRKYLAQQKHLARKRRRIRRKQNERLYRLAYLRFKKGRIELLQKLGKLKKAYRLGWSADKEWRAWKRVLKVNKQKRKWRKRTNYALDDVQRLAERRMFDAFRDSKRD
jgi:hypothetical protein